MKKLDPNVEKMHVEVGLLLWANNEIYLDNNGNYRWNPKTVHNTKSSIIPVNKSLKRAYPNHEGLHKAAIDYNNKFE